jgi:hypothetical protein
MAAPKSDRLEVVRHLLHAGCHVIVVSESTWLNRPWEGIGHDSLFNRMWEVLPYEVASVEMWVPRRVQNPFDPPTVEVCTWEVPNRNNITQSARQPPGHYLVNVATTALDGTPPPPFQRWGVSARHAMMVEFVDPDNNPPANATYYTRRVDPDENFRWRGRQRRAPLRIRAVEPAEVLLFDLG